ncbi:MAG: prepilin peptidase [Pirellulales bacterium]|nr:prepilin peptidase [Pirellulales bacterium]
MNLIFAMPMPVRLLLLFAIGACVGGAVNWAIYSLAWYRRPISPWSRRDPAAPPRRLSDRLPIVGWLRLRREKALFGRGFWIRPMCLEIFTGLGLALLYWWEVVAAGLYPAGLEPFIMPQGMTILHLQFFAHCILIALMLAGSIIDVDEQIIPDEITVPGTLVGLLLAAAWPWSLLPDVMIQGLHIDANFLHLASPNPWLARLGGAPLIAPLAIGLACWWLWCVALLPRTWYTRHGLRRAMQLCCARVARQRTSYRILRMALIGAAVIALIWFRGGEGWTGLLSALVGIAVGGGLIWLVRILASAALQREAMGFGDVTLMAMIGAFLGWQPCIVIFFLAPVAGVIIALIRFAWSRDKVIPYGPFLCLATLFAIVFWNAVWDYTWPYFEAGWLAPAAMLVCLALMAAMLGAWRMIRGLL